MCVGVWVGGWMDGWLDEWMDRYIYIQMIAQHGMQGLLRLAPSSILSLLSPPASPALYHCIQIYTTVSLCSPCLHLYTALYHCISVFALPPPVYSFIPLYLCVCPASTCIQIYTTVSLCSHCLHLYTDLYHCISLFPLPPPVYRFIPLYLSVPTVYSSMPLFPSLPLSPSLFLSIPLSHSVSPCIRLYPPVFPLNIINKV